MDEQLKIRTRRTHYFEARPANRRTSGFWQILPPPARELDRRTPYDTTPVGAYETSYDIGHGYGLERTIIEP